MPTHWSKQGTPRSEPKVPTWVVVMVVVAVLGVAAFLFSKALFPPPLRVEAEPGSEGARWAELMKRTGGQGPVGTRPYAGEPAPQGGHEEAGH